MAGNGDRDVICSARARDCANGFGQSDFSSDLRVRGGATRRDFAQRLPDPLLKGSSTHVQGEVEPQIGSFHKTDHLCDQLLIFGVATNETSLGEPVLQILRERVGIISDQDRYDALLLSRQLCSGSGSSPAGSSPARRIARSN
jgi:hypothetical protein